MTGAVVVAIQAPTRASQRQPLGQRWPYTPIEARTAVIIPLLVFVIPSCTVWLGVVLAVITVMGVTDHLGREIFPGQCGRGVWAVCLSPRTITSVIISGMDAIMSFFSASETGSTAPTTASAHSIARRAVASAALLAVLPGAMPVADLHVEVAQLRSTKGMLRLCLTADPANFPACIDDARAVTRSVPASQGAVTFAGLPTGDYAFAVIHDENSNRKLDTLLGIPREGFGFSRNPVIGFGPPRFTAARFALSGDADTQQVRMKYMF